MTVECRVANFKELYDALKKSLQEGREKVYDYLAQRERAAGKYGAERENALRHSIGDLARKNHLDKVSIDNGGPIDKALGAAADDAKKFGGGLAEARDQLGAMGPKGRENVVNGLSQIDPTNPGGVVGKVFGGGGRSVRAARRGAGNHPRRQGARPDRRLRSRRQRHPRRRPQVPPGGRPASGGQRPAKQAGVGGRRRQPAQAAARP